MSFFDDDEPETRTARPRRATGATTASRAAAPAGGGGSEQQSLMVRRAMALGLIALLLILVVVGVNSCRNSAKKNGLRDYNRDVANLIGESDSQVGERFFALFGGTRQSAPALQSSINQFRVVAEDQLDRARNLDAPGDMAGAQRNLLLTLSLRSGALGRIADKIRSAYAPDRNTSRTAVNQIAGQMQVFLASDVVHSQRVAPLIKEGLDDNDIAGEVVKESHFLPNLGWLNPTTVAQRLGRPGSGGGGDDGPTAPGLHGHGLDTVKVGETTLQPTPAVNRIPASASLAFNVAFLNQGENDEADVNVRVRIQGSGKPITVSKAVDQTTKGSPATVSVPLGQAPPVGTPVTIRVEVLKVPGEMKVDNNSQTFTAIFTR